MLKLTNEIKKRQQFFEWRENVLKKKPMTELEKNMAKLFEDNGIKFHRSFPIIIGRKHPQRYAVSFWCPERGIIFDLYEDGDDMSVYRQNRHVKILFHSSIKVSAIIPIPIEMSWREVKKQLKMLFSTPYWK